MNILYTNFHVDEGGGHTTYILSLVDNPEHSIFVACPPTSRLYARLKQRSFKRLLPMHFPSRLNDFAQIVKSCLELRKIINQQRIDIVHTNGSPDNRLAFYASLLPGRKFKIVFTKHNTYKVRKGISRWRFTTVNSAVIGVSRPLFDVLGLPSHPKFHIVENCIDTDFWQRSSLPETGENLTFISNAGLARHKGWTYLTQAVALLPPDLKQRVTVVLAGREEAETAPDVAWAKENGNLRVTGFIEDAREILEKADVGFVLSTHRESCSFACREMMSMGLPVIVSDFDCLKANIDEECGWVAGLRNVEDTKNVLLKILALSPDELKKKKMAARKKAERDFSIQNMLDGTNRVYATVMAGR